MGEPAYDVVWPLGKTASEMGKLATRLSGLNGKTVCEVYGAIFKSELIFPSLREALRERYPDIKFVDYTNFGNIIHSPNEKELLAGLPDLLRKHGCDAVVAGVGG